MCRNGAPTHPGVWGRHVLRRHIFRAQQTKSWRVGSILPTPCLCRHPPNFIPFRFRADALNSHFQNSFAALNMITRLPTRYSKAADRTGPPMPTPALVKLLRSWHGARRAQGHSTKNFLAHKRWPCKDRGYCQTGRSRPSACRGCCCARGLRGSGGFRELAAGCEGFPAP